MGVKSKNILTINAGSSSIKLDLFLVTSHDIRNDRRLTATINGIGQPNGSLTVQESPGVKQTTQLVIANQAEAIQHLVRWLDNVVQSHPISAIGHRIVHGGPKHDQAVLITDDLVEALQSFISFAPHHAPAALRLIDALRQQYPSIPQVACFDTAFFHDLPRVAQMLPLPRKFEAIGLRRYGFHGLSYTYLLSTFQTMAGDVAANGRVIFAHLGSGASLAATRNGKPVDTTMGFTPSSGIMMSSRSGDLDPGVLGFLQQQTGISIEEYTRMVNFESGLLGVSETSADMYTLLQQEATDIRAAEAVNLFVYNVKKSIGALSATLGGLDSLVFSGGIGEQSVPIRSRVCKELGYLGIELDEMKNEQKSDLISAIHSRVGVHIIPTDEAQIITAQVIKTLNTNQAWGDA